MTYLRHAITCPSEFLEEEKRPNLTYDRKEMIWELKVFAQTLVDSGVDKLFQYCRKLKNFDFDSKDIRDMINFLMQNLSPDNLPSRRTFNKANFSEKNLIFTYLALKSEREIVKKLLLSFLIQYKPNLQRKDDLINNFLFLNEQVKNMANSCCKKIIIKIDLNNQNSNEFQINEDILNESLPELVPIGQPKYIRLPGIENFAFTHDLY